MQRQKRRLKFTVEINTEMDPDEIVDALYTLAGHKGENVSVGWESEE